MGKVLENPLFRIGVGAALIYFGGPTGWGLVARSVGANILLGEAARRFGPEPPRRNVTPQTVTAYGANLPGAVLYGEVRTSGMLYMPFPGTSGIADIEPDDTKKYLHYLLVLAVHEVEEIGAIWFDTDEIPVSAIGVDGIVTEGRFADKLLIERFLGTDDQLASTVLTAAIPDWTANFRGRGIAYLHLRMERDDEAFPQGPPNNIFAMVKGRKVYDPRSGSTVFSDNPALCLRDYLVTYCGGTTDDTLVSAAANICDELVTVPGGVQKRYRAAGLLSTGSEPADNITDLLSAMNGVTTFAKGKFRMFAGAYDAPTQTIDESWLAGAVSIQLQTPGEQTYNTVRGEYIDPQRNYQAVEHELITSSAFITLDGRTLEQQVAYPFTFNEYQAQRQSYQRLLQSRGQRTLTMPLNLKALNIDAWDTVNVSLSRLGINEVYRVVDWKWGDSAPVTVILREESSGHYAAPTYITATTLVQGGTVPESPNAPNNLVIIPGTGGNQVTWTNPPARQFDQIEIWRSPDTDFANAVLVATVRASSYFDIIASGDTPAYWIRAKNTSAQFSAYIPDSTGPGAIGGSGPSPPGGGALYATLSATSQYVIVGNFLSAQTDDVICRAYDGTSPYTYLWERVSGSTAISPASSTAATTKFIAGPASNVVRSAIFKCTVTDSASPEAVADSPNITVTIQYGDLA